MTSNQGGSKGIQQANSRVKAENQGNVNSLQEDDELVNNSVDENVQNGCKQVAVQGNYIRQTPQQQPQGSLAHWERFLHVRSIKVMLVEDDDCTRHIVTALLRNCNYEVIQAANGFQAWKILENLSNHIDIVLTEVVMPCLSGIGLLCKIMSHKTRKNVPVIMMSSHDSMGLVFKCLSKGAVDFLVKPIRKNELKILWQHVWRRCHSSSGSGSESGTKAQKSVNSKGNLGYDSSGSKNGDENERTDDGSDDGNGTQSSWAKQAIECESPEAASSTEYPDSTCGFVIRPTNDQEAQPDDVGNGIEIAISQSRNLEMQIEFPIDVLISNKDKVLDNNMPGPHMENGENEGQEPEKTIIDDSNGLKVGETGLKRPRETENDVRDVQNGCNILRHSELSAFTRYKTNSSAVKGTPGIIASCSQPVNRSNIVKKESKRDVHSDGYLIYQGSSEQIIPKNADVITRDNLNQEPQIQHIHHHHQVHHYHNLDTEEPLSNQETFGLNKLAVDAPHCGSSNIMGGPVEGNFESYSLNKSASGGSMHGSNGGNPAVNFEVTDVESNVGVPGKSGSGDASGGGGGDDGSGGGGNGDHNKSAQREAALIKFRQKREVRCFQKKVRYQNRKKLADQRPRVRGQFVKGTSRDSLNKAANG